MLNRCVVMLLSLVFASAGAQTRDENWTLCRGAQWDAQIAACGRLITDNGLTPQQRAEAYNLRGIGYERGGDLDSAIADYGAATVADPKLESAYANRAKVYNDLELYSEAEADEQMALALNGNDIFALMEAGDTYQATQRVDTAKNYYIRVTQMPVKTENDYLERGLAHSRLGEPELAIADDNMALTLSTGKPIDREDSLVYNNRGVEYDRQNNQAKALEDFKAAIKADPGFVLPRRNLCNTHLHIGDLGQAEVDCAEALKVAPNDDATLSEMGFLRFVQGDYDAALTSAQAAVRVRPSRNEAFNLGLYQFMKGDYAEAATQFRASIEKNPKYLYAAMWLWMTEQRPGGRAGKRVSEYPEVFAVQDWPAPAFRMMSGIGTADQVSLDIWKDAKDSERLGRFCEVYFYNAEGELANGLEDEAKADFGVAKDICPRGFVEYGGALGELKRMEAVKPAVRHPAASRPAATSKPSTKK